MFFYTAYPVYIIMDLFNMLANDSALRFTIIFVDVTERSRKKENLE